MRETKVPDCLHYTVQKDYKRAMKRGLKIELLEKIIEQLAMGEVLPEKNRDHELTGNWQDIVNATSNGLAARVPH